MRILCEKHSLSLAALKRQVKHEFGVSDGAWLGALINGLQRDGLLAIDRARRRVRLP